jgi:membrane protein DedA with SNARE-associated domain
MTAVTVSHMVASYGYVTVFAAVALESLGVPIPGETTLVVAAAYAGATHKLALLPVVVVAVLGAVVGDNIGYLVGASAGKRVLLRVGRLLRMDGSKLEAKLAIVDYLFSRHGGKLVFFGRFVTLLRTYAALLAGVGRMRWSAFLFYNALGGFVWAVAFGVGGYEFGGLVTRIGNATTVGLGVGVVIAAVLGLVAMRRYGARIQARAEAAILQSK